MTAGAGAPVFAEYPKTVVLTDGTHVILRPWAAGDPAPPSVPPRPDTAGDRITVLAIDGERIAAAATLDPPVSPGAAATLGVTIEPAYRNRRLGTWLLLDLVHLAAGLGVERLLAVAPSADAMYLAALRRLDFVPDGAPAIPIPPGTVVFAKVIHTAWTDF